MKYDIWIRNEQYGAGTTHRWDKDKYGIRGVGIARRKIKENMVLKVRKSYYKVTRDAIMEFMNAHPHSRYNAKGTELYVVPLTIMEFVKSENFENSEKRVKKEKQPAKPKSDQLKLL